MTEYFINHKWSEEDNDLQSICKRCGISRKRSANFVSRGWIYKYNVCGIWVGKKQKCSEKPKDNNE